MCFKNIEAILHIYFFNDIFPYLGEIATSKLGHRYVARTRTSSKRKETLPRNFAFFSENGGTFLSLFQSISWIVSESQAKSSMIIFATFIRRQFKRSASDIHHFHKECPSSAHARIPASRSTLSSIKKRWKFPARDENLKPTAPKRDE